MLCKRRRQLKKIMKLLKVLILELILLIEAGKDQKIDRKIKKLLQINLLLIINNRQLQNIKKRIFNIKNKNKDKIIILNKKLNQNLKLMTLK